MALRPRAEQAPPLRRQPKPTLRLSKGRSREQLLPHPSPLPLGEGALSVPYPIESNPVYGRSTSGMDTVPSAC